MICEFTSDSDRIDIVYTDPIVGHLMYVYDIADINVMYWIVDIPP